MLLLFWKALHSYYFHMDARSAGVSRDWQRTLLTSLQWTVTSDASQVTLKMSAHAKKKKNWLRMPGFQQDMVWQILLKAVCLICGTQVAVLKDYNLNRHYMTKHEDKYRNLFYEERTRESALLAKLHTQRCSRQLHQNQPFLWIHSLAHCVTYL